MHLHSKLIIVLLSLLPTLSWALPSDREQPIEIEADHAQIDDKQGITQYKGKAILTQGTLRIEGDIITFYYDENKQLSKAIAEGNLATYKQIQKPGEEPVRARALRMEYHAKAQKIYLIGKGHVWQANDEFSGNKIEYDIARNIVNANSAPVKVDGETHKGQRVHIIIQPPGSKKKTSPKLESPKVAPASAVEPTPSETVPLDDGYPSAIVTATRLNIRSGPGQQYDKLGSFIQGSKLIVLTEQKDWVQVRGMIGSQVIIGWIHRRYIQLN
ncbi:MAG: lipopolysaccharide transport periplasmic protein LptA [Gammaproteobacteria bacterium]|nr:MAG: lipopolysaccharide transport periplasmic protein LptA [Gammaproteobacteria bacterium]RKZ95899.1 MAG: lipopolysaccharide transport periplasmic protein LptA [Gammaproteobacteria bacterium]RKZ96351.1 MAG: lipopolysaccharide transport periplasmic protein LptA [Gammaproteobacteria bacterium]RLA01347.1 MAG: lipopolysaccharide transport periplasmic protein LptA [Gammaproteobacteria bacterium]